MEAFFDQIFRKIDDALKQNKSELIKLIITVLSILLFYVKKHMTQKLYITKIYCPRITKSYFSNRKSNPNCMKHIYFCLCIRKSFVLKCFCCFKNKLTDFLDRIKFQK